MMTKILSSINTKYQKSKKSKKELDDADPPKPMRNQIRWRRRGEQTLIDMNCIFLLGTVCSHSNKGWFETKTFGQSFKLLLMPNIEKLPPRKKVIIGDTLGCNFEL